MLKNSVLPHTQQNIFRFEMLLGLESVILKKVIYAWARSIYQKIYEKFRVEWKIWMPKRLLFAKIMYSMIHVEDFNFEYFNSRPSKDVSSFCRSLHGEADPNFRARHF